MAVDAPPAPAAVAPAAPSPAPGALAPDSAQSKANLNDAFADLDKMISEPEPAPPKPKPEPKKNGEPAAKTPEPGKDSKEPLPPEKMAPKQLREAYEALKHKHAELEKAHTEFKTKAATPAEDPEKKTLAERLESERKARVALEDEMRFVSYENSEEYKERYEKPFLDAYNAGRAKIGSLKVIERKNPETDELVQQSRPATPQDFDTIMRIQDDDAAADLADRLFGTKSSMVLFHRERVQELNRARLTAKEEYRTKGAERDKLRQEGWKTQMDTISKEGTMYWQKHVNSAHEKYPQWFKPAEGDEKGNALLTKGFDDSARAFANLNAFDPRLSPQEREEMIALHASIFNKAAGFNRLAYQVAAKDKRIKELEADLEKYQGSEPGSAQGKRGEPVKAKTWEQQMEEMVS